MLQIDKAKSAAEIAAPASDVATPEELYSAFIAFVSRQYPVVLFVTLAVLALGFVYIFTTPPKYTGKAALLIDSHRLTLFQQQNPMGVDVPVDTAMVDSQVELLKSENIALSVVKELHLADDPEFVSPSGVIGTMFGLISSTGSALLGSTEPLSEFALTRRALGTFESDLTVKRVGLTYVIDIDFDSLSPTRAAQVANAIADAYVVDSLEAKYQSSKRAAVWLQDRLKELRSQAKVADRAVVDFKAQHHIVDTGGQLLNEQQLAETNSALMLAQENTAEAKARLDRVQDILQKETAGAKFDDTATVTESLHDDVITKLREQYLDIEAREKNWATKYGYNHLAVVNLRNQMQEIRQSIDSELRRIAETYQSDYAIAESREEAVKKGLEQSIAQTNLTNQAQITLSDLTATAQSYRALADNFLQNYMMSVQQQSFPISESRLITTATPPLGKSKPKTFLILAVAGAGGLILAFGIGVLRDLSDRVFRTGSQVEDRLQTDCIAVLPFVKASSKKTSLPGSPDPRAPMEPRTIVRDNSLLWHVLDSPFSRFSEGIRSIKVAGDLLGATKSNKVIGITSSLPNEGKSTVGIALAQQVAHAGSRVLIVDCDIRNPSLTKRLAASASIGLIEVLSGTASVAEAVWTDPSTSLHVLPTFMKTRIPHSSDLLGSTRMKELITSLRDKYDFIVLDMSPLTPVVDVRATANLVDSYVFVIEWGCTKIELVEHALNAARGVYQNLLGVVLNKANLNSLNRYESYRGNYYYKRYYARYGYTE